MVTSPALIHVCLTGDARDFAWALPRLPHGRRTYRHLYPMGDAASSSPHSRRVTRRILVFPAFLA